MRVNTTQMRKRIRLINNTVTTGNNDDWYSCPFPKTIYLPPSIPWHNITYPFTFLLLDDCQEQSATHKIWNHPFGLHLSLAIAAVIRKIARAVDQQTQDLRGNWITKDSQGCLVAYLIHSIGKSQIRFAEENSEDMRQDCGWLSTRNAKDLPFQPLCQILAPQKFFMRKEIERNRSYHIRQEEQTHPKTKVSLSWQRKHFTGKGQTQRGTYVQERQSTSIQPSQFPVQLQQEKVHAEKTVIYL